MLAVLRHRGARPWLVLAAFVWLVANIVTQWHESVVPHVRCPEHGEMLEVRSASSSEHDELATAPDDPHHQACAVHAAGAGPLPALNPPCFAPEPAPPDEVVALASIRLASRALRFAPKTSPPPA